MARRIKLGQAYEPVKVELEWPDGKVREFTVRGDLTEETLGEMDDVEAGSPKQKLANLFQCDASEFDGIDLRDLAFTARVAMEDVMEQVQGRALNPTKGAAKE